MNITILDNSIPKMSDDKKNPMPPMKARLSVANFALKALFKEGTDKDGKTILSCNCAKCTHETTTEDKRCNIKDSNANMLNTTFQHLWGIGMVKFSYDNKCYIDPNEMWSPEKGWYCQEQQHDKVDPAKSQVKSTDGSKPSVDSASGKEDVKSTKVSDRRSYASVLDTTAEKAGPSNGPADVAEVVQSTPEVYFTPILTTNTSIEGKPETEVSYIPAIIVSDGKPPMVVSPDYTLPKDYKSVKTPYDEEKNLYFSPVIVFDGNLEQVIRFQPRIFMESEGIYKYYI